MQHLFFLLAAGVIFIEYTQPVSTARSELCIPHSASYCPAYCDASGQVKEPQYCPTFCDASGEMKGPLCCKDPPICCIVGDKLDCCYEPDKQVTSVISDGWNCTHKERKTPMETLTTALIWLSVFVAAIAILATVTVYTTQSVKRNRSNRGRSETGSSCASDVHDTYPATSNPVGNIILHPIMVSPPPYTPMDHGIYPGGALPTDNPPSYEEVANTSEV